jgi:hypothetical protein
MSYARLSRRRLLFRSFTGLEITEFDIISNSDTEYNTHREDDGSILDKIKQDNVEAARKQRSKNKNGSNYPN